MWWRLRDLCVLSIALVSANAVAVVYTPGSFAVSDSGAATYSIPINLPPGTAGLEPSLALAYHSQSGEGILGVGWSLSGASSIHRCGRTIALDASNGGVEYDSNDRFCLDGQRLVVLPGYANGGNGSEYRTERESFNRIRSYGLCGSGPCWWRVESKGGQILDYGVTEDSRIQAADNPGARADVNVWAVNIVKDRFSNCIGFAYEEAPNHSYFRLKTVKYTGRDAGATCSGTYADVEFAYSPRSLLFGSSLTAYQGGSILDTPGLLSSITTKVNTVVTKVYLFGYHSPNGYTRRYTLANVKECAADTVTCLSPTTFSYHSTAHENRAAVATTISADYARSQLGDFNGDGRSDIATFASNGSATLWHGAVLGFAGPSTAVAGFQADSSRNVVADVDGDGRSDVLIVDDGGVVRLKKGAGNTLSTPTTSPWANFAISSFFAYCLNSGKVGDFDGDGRADLYLVGKVALSRGDSATTPVDWPITPPPPPPPPIPGGTGITCPGASGEIGDFNGDGKSDFVYRGGSNEFLVDLSTGSGFTRLAWPIDTTLPAANLESGIKVGDFNGDGLSDVLYLLGDGSARRWLSTGKGFSASLGLALGWVDGARARNKLADLNGDSRADIVQTKSDGSVQAVYSTGTGLAGPQVWGTGLNGDSARNLLADFNGDGQTDAVNLNGAGLRRYSTEICQDCLYQVTNGVGAFAQVNYAPLSTQVNYTKLSSAVYPSVDFQGSMFVVTVAGVSNAVGVAPQNVNITSYSYTGAKTHVTGGGFLGFASVSAGDAQRNIITTTDYLQGYDPAGTSTFGLASASRTTTTGGTTLKNTTYEYRTAIPTDGNRPFVVGYKTRENSYDEANTGTPFTWTETLTETTDGHGNPTVIRITSSDGFSKVTSNLYTNDVTSWILGRLTSAQVTSNKPSGVAPLQLIRTSSFAYNPTTGALQQEVIEPNNPDLRLQTDYGYDIYGNKQSVTTSGGVSGSTSFVPSRTSYSYFEAEGLNPAGRFATRLVNALGHTERRKYDERFGGITSVTDPNLVEVKTVYDVFGRRASETPPVAMAPPTTFEYVKCGTGSSCSWTAYMIYIRRSSSPTVRQEFDMLDRLTREWTNGFAAGSSIMTKGTDFDRLGRPSVVYGRAYYPGPYPFARVDQYDVFDRVKQEKAPNGAITTHSYSGFTTTTTNGKGQQTQRITNSQGWLVSVTNALNGNATLEKSTILYDYDPVGNVVQTKDSKNNITSMTYDLRGRKIDMTDPDMGRWSYAYDALGQLARQTDPKGRAATTPYSTTFKYDLLGRIKERSDVDLLSTWTYDSCTKGTGRLCASATNNGFSRTYAYDTFSRPSTSTTNIFGVLYSTGATYDSKGRVLGTYYPSVTIGTTTTGLVLKNVYNSDGYLAEIRDNATNALYWQANALNANLQVTQETLGNGAVTARQYNANTYWLEGIGTTKGATKIQSQGYSYDPLGNLASRLEGCVNSACTTALSETFGYDNLNRLLTVASTTHPIVNRSYAYDSIGNMTYKSDVGTLTYAGAVGGVRPHAVTSIAGTVNGVANPTYSYDANGNMFSGAGQFVTYTSYNMPSSISKTGLSTPTTFQYDTERQRFYETYFAGNIHYVRNGGMLMFERVVKGSLLEYKHYIHSPSGLVAIYTQRNAASPTLSDIRYVHKDHLGSTSVISDANGAVVERLAYDAWGKRRNVDGTVPATPPASLTRYGFTGHEHLDEVGLVHMNGRVYDPTIGRFLSPDPNITAADLSQDYNRYSYVLNNPLSMTDPTGYSWLSKFFKKVERALRPYIRPILAIAANVFLPGSPLFSALGLSGASGSIAAGFISGAISGGDLQSGLVGGLSAGLFSGLHYDPKGLGEMIGKVAAHGVVGGAMSEGMGGDFQSGFMAAAFTQAVSLSGAFDKLAADPTTAAGRFKNAVAAAVVGGTASVVGGGKFANGAITGAFSRLFNDLLEFDGEALFWKDDDGKVLKSWPAVSGAPGSSPDDMYTKVGFGPIPQGDYTVDPAATNHWGPIKALRDWGNVDDWGFSRTQIVPKPGTFQGFRKAGSMYLHGGSRPGSAGCIDLTRYNGHFHSYLRSYGKPVDLVVKYKNWVPTPF